MNRFSPLKIPAFRRLVGVYAINRLGDMVALIAMAIVVWDKTHNVSARCTRSRPPSSSRWLR
jgi:hypothetical protein